MADAGPLNPNHQVAIVYPDLPEDCGNRLNTLITAIEQISSHFSTSSGHVQSVMSQANGAVQHVSIVSSGKGAQALVQTWTASQTDGKQTHTGMSDAAAHLSASLSALYENVPVIQNNMSTLNMVRNNGGTVASIDSDDVQRKINDLTNALGNIGTALQLASTLLSGMNNSWPRACATGFIPGSSLQPTFTPHSFDPHSFNDPMYMSRGKGETPGGRKITNHAQESLPRHKMTPEQVDDVIDNYSQRASQGDDATAYIKKQPGRGRKYSIVIEGKDGIVTAMRDLTPQELRHLAKNYKFDPGF